MEKVVTKVVTLEEILCLDLKGKVIVFPTDTVYGVGALADDEEAIERIYALKKREHDKPLAILCGNKNQIIPYVQNTDHKALELIEQFWPGALTIIFKRTESLSSKITKGKDTVAFRMPNSSIALKILNTFGMMATTSVNISGEKELNSVKEILDTFDGQIDYIVSDEETFESLPSTVYDATSSKVVRQGSVVIG